MSTAIMGYHAHIYFTPETRGVAASVREEIGRDFAVELGRWHEVPIGPHTAAMYQVGFDTKSFADIVPWLMLHRAGLSILVHPLTGDDYDDHATYALWLGTPLILRLDVLMPAHAKN